MFTLQHTNLSIKITLFTILGFVCIFSLGVVVYYGDHFLLGTYATMDNDDVKYIESAMKLLNDHTLTYNSGNSPTAFIMPGVPLILAGLMAIFGQNDAAILSFRVLQALLQVGCIFLLFVIARYVFNSRVALIACFISTFYLPDYYVAGVILSEAWFKTIFMLLLIYTIAAIEKRRTCYYVIVACLLALACYFKPQAALYPLIFVIPWLLRGYSLKQMFGFTLVILVTFCLLLTPWWVRNYQSFNRWIPFTSSAGSPILEGTFIFGKLPSDEFFVQFPQYTQANIQQGSQHSKIETAIRILKYGIMHDPIRYITWYTVIKTMLLYISPFYWKSFLGVSYISMLALHVIMVIMAALGLTKSWKRKKGKKLAVLLALTYFTLIYLPFVAFDRYGYPNHFIMIIFAAYMGESLYISLKTRSEPANAI